MFTSWILMTALSAPMQKIGPELRQALATTDGKKVETVLPVDGAVKMREDWSAMAVPVAAIAGLKETSGAVSEMRLFGDSPAILYLGMRSSLSPSGIASPLSQLDPASSGRTFTVFAVDIVPSTKIVPIGFWSARY